MCITKTVGAGGTNARSDVKILQLLLNMNRERCGLANALVADGLWGAASTKALAAFRSAAHIKSDKPLTAGDETLEALRRGMPHGLVPEKLRAIMTEADLARAERFFAPITATLARYAINTPLRMAHFLAQIAHESGSLRYTKELADGTAYEGRADLGNVKPGDGPLFKGRGLIQLTGRTNYRLYGKACGRDFEAGSAPDLVSDDRDLAVDVAGWFWSTHKLNDWADKDDVREVTRRINGGFNGLTERTGFLTRAKWLLIL